MPGLTKNAIKLYCKCYNNYQFGYACDLKNETTEITNEFFTINGNHLINKDDIDVISLIVYMKKLSYLPEIFVQSFKIQTEAFCHDWKFKRSTEVIESQPHRTCKSFSRYCETQRT